MRKGVKKEKETENQLVSIAMETLNRCLLESIGTIPEFKGRVDCLSDNSGSSRGTMVSEYGSTNIYEIANLSAILTAYRAKKGGSVWVFGDKIMEYKVSHDKSILEQLDEVNDIGNKIGQQTETGVWLFWEKAINERMQLDTVFIYSDMQAGHGGLYAFDEHTENMNIQNAIVPSYGSTCYVNVLQLVDNYRKHVYSKVNLFSVQVAGYDNSIVPDILYRGAVLSGWTGKEAKLAYEMIEIWDKQIMT